METKEIIKQLNNIRELMTQEKYTDAIALIDKLKEKDKTSDFDYTYTHQLYQLDSNARSLYNQQIVLKCIKKFSLNQNSITFRDLNEMLKSNNELNLSEDILRREIEILILRNQLKCKLEGEHIHFQKLNSS